MGARERLNVGEARMKGISTRVGANLYQVLIRDRTGKILLATTEVTNPATETGSAFTKGAMVIKSNAAVDAVAMYENIGSSTVAKFRKPGSGLQMYVCTPATIVADRYVTSVDMKVGAYAIANASPADGLAHNISVTHTAVGAVDTLGTIDIVGTDINGAAISEAIIPLDGTKAVGAKAFKTVTSATGAGWVINAGNDTIVIGYDETIGLPDIVAATSDMVLVVVSTGVLNAPTLVVGAAVSQCTVLMVSGDATKRLRVLYRI